MILVKNEKDRLPDALASVSFADEIVVADTGSTDGTQDLARERGARVVEIPWEGFVASRNRALALAKNDWVLVLDADERVPPELRESLLAALAKAPESLSGFRMPRLSYFFDEPVRHGTWYPDVKLRVGRRSRGIRAEGGRVHEVLVVNGPVKRLRHPLLHFPNRSMSEALRKGWLYASLGAEDRYDRGARGGVTSLWFRPAMEFLRCYVLKGGFLDGGIGVYVASFHASYYFLRAAFLLERTRKERRPGGSS